MTDHDHLCPSCRPGTVQFFRDASSSFDAWTLYPDQFKQLWMRDHYARMRVYSPYFDTRTSWYGNGLVYQDAYAIYTDSELAKRHPEWILRDDKGEPLYIPYGAKPYKQYAADITNPAWADYWIAAAREKLSHGYRGVFVDDVNYYRRVCDATGNEKGVQVGKSGVLDDALWQHCMTYLMWQIRDRLDCEIVHNVVWYVPENSDVTAGLSRADWVNIERGVNDPGIKGGTGKWSLRPMLDWIDRRHAAGVNVIFDSQATSDSAREYGLACYFLTSNGGDMIGTRQGGAPDDWWAGYDTILGQPKTERYVTARADGATPGLLTRQFEFGGVYVNEPGALPYVLPDRTLGPASGAVVLR